MSEHPKELFRILQGNLENETDPLRREYLKGVLSGITIAMYTYDKEGIAALLQEKKETVIPADQGGLR
ncbi:MAG: hypothetical protein IKG46_15485 [Solobacterium sp.]|nr:hypothetical protein [Solobacterium sp.]